MRTFAVIKIHPMIKNILFDMGGVVFRQNTEEAFSRFRAIGIDPDYYMGAYGQKDFFLDLECGKIGESEFCERLAIAANRPSISWDEAQHCWLGFLQDVPVERLHNLAKFKEKYHIGLLSNTNSFIMAFTRSNNFSAEGKPISDYFDVLHCSYEMGICKPDAQIFLSALKEDGFKPEETIFVDDSLKNIEAAKKLGIIGLFVPENQDWNELLTKLLQEYNK